MKVKLACFGGGFKLECPLTNVLVIHLTSLSIPAENSSLCKNEGAYAVPCDILMYSNLLKSKCSGRQKCRLNTDSERLSPLACNTRFVITVVYECRKMKINTTSRAVISSSKNIVEKTFEVHSVRPTDLRTIFSNRNETTVGNKIGSVTCLLYTLFSATVALQYMQGKPKHVILCVVLSISAGIVLLIITFLVMACVERIIEEKHNRKKESTAMEISLPLLVTPGSQPQNSTQAESVPASDSGSGAREATLPRAQSIRRSHSVDEGTQTEPELDEICSIDNGLSDNEAKELGYLVDIMRYYNSNLENMSTPNEPISLRRTTPTETPNTSKRRTELSYTGPRIVDTSRRRQPRLSSATYSSSNNSENGDASTYLPTPSIRHNHINAASPSISTLPRRKAHLLPKYDTLGHTTNSIHSYDSPKMQNGPRRIVGRTRFMDEAPHTISKEVYGI
ncbi:uncharacterized protein LOC135685479 isoform X2 [Rhopilema esculentum]